MNLKLGLKSVYLIQILEIQKQKHEQFKIDVSPTLFDGRFLSSEGAAN